MKRDDKKKVIKQFGVHAKDTGSANVQVAILTEKINSLSQHLEDHPKDNHSRKGLLKMVGQRRKSLNYMKLNKKGDYEELIKKLKLRK
jgi:small subunit ribosomal protein S15